MYSSKDYKTSVSFLCYDHECCTLLLSTKYRDQTESEQRCIYAIKDEITNV